jgi:coenzyme F430 synthetase
MYILVLDTIHGGKAIGDAFAARGDQVDLVDVYRGESDVDVGTALSRNYDLVVAPVHLDPSHPLVAHARAPVITHHEAVRQLLDGDLPEPMIEITGARGKTTTAHALASIMPGSGILHTSTGTYRFPEKTLVSRSGITPGSVIAAARLARGIRGWLIAEESLGVTGAGTIAIITSREDYSFAAGQKNAVSAKVDSTKHSRLLLLAEGIPADYREGIVHIGDVATTHGTECTITLNGNSCRFTNPLLALPGYHDAIMLAATAALMMGIDPASLSAFAALPGRMSVSYDRDVLIVDNANSGTNLATTIDAAQYARTASGQQEITLVIGQQEGDGAVCEGFPHDQILAAVDTIHPDRLVWVGGFPTFGTPEYPHYSRQVTAQAPSLEAGLVLAKQLTEQGSIVLAVKTWR